MTQLKQVWQWIRNRRRYRIVDVVDAADDIPDVIPKWGAVLVGAAENPTWVAFDCPCQGGHRIMLNLDSRRHPRWKVRGAVSMSLYPSVDASVGARRCHYVISDGKVRWVPDLTDS